jgi:putative drug exporter of the RND superfamily
MTSITRVALRHRKARSPRPARSHRCGVLPLSSTTSGFTHSFATPGTPAYEANHAIQLRFGIDGNEQPTIAVLRLPPGQTM